MEPFPQENSYPVTGGNFSAAGEKTINFVP
jgi:hypothetical protein